MKHPVMLLVAALFSLPMSAQQKIVEKLTVEARADYVRNSVDGENIKSESGFKGEYLNVKLSGHITDKFSYSMRQRLNKSAYDSNFFDATDWLLLNYSPDYHVTLSAGKQIILIGGYEYDRPPIDLYYCSEFWNNIPCYEWGASAQYRFSKRDRVVAQLCRSPYQRRYDNAELYAYNLIWYGQHGIWNTIWSANMAEWNENRYISFIALGNRFNFSRHWQIELDFMNRAANHQTYFLRDCSVIGELCYKPSSRLNITAKVSYDVNRTHHAADLSVMPGTELTRVGAGVEYFPADADDVRIHANYCYTAGRNGNPEGALKDKQSIIDVGLTWRLNIIK